jgi:hypothetical protein
MIDVTVLYHIRVLTVTFRSQRCSAKVNRRHVAACDRQVDLGGNDPCRRRRRLPRSSQYRENSDDEVSFVGFVPLEANCIICRLTNGPLGPAGRRRSRPIPGRRRSIPGGRSRRRSPSYASSLQPTLGDANDRRSLPADWCPRQIPCPVRRSPGNVDRFPVPRTLRRPIVGPAENRFTAHGTPIESEMPWWWLHSKAEVEQKAETVLGA